MASLSGWPAIAHTLRHPNFASYVAGNSVSLVGLWTQRIAIGWLAWELTGSGAWLGAIAFADLFPSVFVGPLAGVIADRTPRLRIMRICQCLSMAQAAVLCALTLAGWVTIEWLLVLVFANGIVVGFNQPSRLALVSRLVTRDHLSTAVAINAIVFNLARFVGPVVAGVLIVKAGVAAAFAANALSYVAFLAALGRIRIREDADARGEAGRHGSIHEALAEGLRYAVGHPGIGPMLALVTAVSVGVRPLAELLPGFASDVFARGAGGLAALASALGIGAVLGGLWLAQAHRTRLAGMVLTASLVSSLLTMGFAATDRFWVALACVGVVGVFTAVVGISAQAVIQLAVEDEVRARVLSLYGIVFRAGPAAGALAMGAASELVGLQVPLLVGAAATVLAWMVVRRRRRDMVQALRLADSP